MKLDSFDAFLRETIESSRKKRCSALRDIKTIFYQTSFVSCKNASNESNFVKIDRAKLNNYQIKEKN